MGKRVSKHWLPSKEKVTNFDINNLNKDNLINNLLIIKDTDITYTFLMTLFGSFNGNSLCKPYDTFDVPANSYKFINNKGKEVSNKNKFITTIGIWIYNIYFFRDIGLANIVGGYQNYTISESEFNDFQQKMIYGLLEKKITIDQYKKFLNYSQFFMWLETILSPNHTEGVLLSSKKIEKKKNELIKKYKKELDNGDVVVSEAIEKELVNYAKEILKDDPGLDVFLSGGGGNLSNNFKNMYIMKGAIKDPNPDAKRQFNIATSNLIDGVSAEEYSLYANALTNGPYSRAKKTEIGGYYENLFRAAFQTITLDKPGSDCGTDKYITVTLTPKNINSYMYNYIVKSNGDLEELTMDNVDKYMNKKVNLRFIIYCKGKQHICNKCAGNFFYRRGSRNIGLATQEMPSAMKVASMKAFHDGSLKTVEIDPMKAFGFEDYD